MKPGEVKKDKGIALLVTVVISFIVLALGLSISNITIRELDISMTIREGMKATYAADSGIECARYWSTKNGKYFSISSPEFDFKDIKCGDENIDTSSNYSSSNGGKTGNYEFVMAVNGSSAGIIIERSEVDDGSDINRRAVVTSVGENGGKTVEAYREYQVEDSFGSGDGGIDLMFAMDISGSISGGERTALFDAVQWLTDQLDPSLDGNHVGATSFDIRGKFRQELTGDRDALLDSVFPNSLHKTNYPTVGGAGTNTETALKFSRMELTNRALEPAPVPYASEINIVGRDRDDSEYRDFIVLLFDVGSTARTTSKIADGSNPGCRRGASGEWEIHSAVVGSCSHNKSNTQIARDKAYQEVLDALDDKINVLVVAVGVKNDGYIRDDFEARWESGAQALVDGDIYEMKTFEIDNYQELQTIFQNSILNELSNISVTPIVEK